MTMKKETIYENLERFFKWDNKLRHFMFYFRKYKGESTSFHKCDVRNILDTFLLLLIIALSEISTQSKSSSRIFPKNII